MATKAKAGTTQDKNSASASAGAESKYTSKKLNKGTTASAGAYSEAEAGAVLKAQKGNASANVGAHAEVGAYSKVENETNIAGPVSK
jgi:hypothetical protein